MEKLLHVGVVRDYERGDYLITAEYPSGYIVLARDFKTVKAAKAALPEVKRDFIKRSFHARSNRS